MTQHTPGPLTAYVNDTEGSHVINEATGYIVCEQHDNEADAILHAAAPAMLEALKQMVEFVETFDSFDVAHPAERTRLTRAKAAIAAAEGPGDTQS